MGDGGVHVAITTAAKENALSSHGGDDSLESRMKVHSQSTVGDTNGQMSLVLMKELPTVADESLLRGQGSSAYDLSPVGLSAISDRPRNSTPQKLL